MKLKKIMVVEDDRDTIEVIGTFLSSEGYITIPISGNFESFIEIAIKSRPDVVLINIQLISVSGVELIKEFKSEPTLVDIPVIAIMTLTNQTLKNKIRNCSEYDAYISKPFNKKKLMETITSFIE